MTHRPYFSLRTGRVTGDVKLSLDQGKRLFAALFEKYEEAGYFQEFFGKYCPDGSRVGKLGSAISEQLLLRFRRDVAWPPTTSAAVYSQDDLFDVIEFCFDCVSKPLEGHHHSWNGCGMHYSTFDQAEGQVEYRLEVNAFLQDMEDGWVLSPEGILESRTPAEFEPLEQATFPASARVSEIEGKVQAAIRRFKQARGVVDEMRVAVRELADVLEFQRRLVKAEMLDKDEDDLFNLANNFHIRHHNSRQKTKYDGVTWLRWMFYVYLATIHAVLRVAERQENSTS